MIVTKHMCVGASVILVGLVLLAAVNPAQAQFVAVDTFQTESHGKLDGQNGWTTGGIDADSVQVAVDPTNPSNQVLRYGAYTNDAPVYTYKPMRVPATSTASTLFLRVRRSGDSNMNWGTTDVAVPTVWADFETQINMQTEDTQGLRVRNADRSVAATQVPEFAVDTWYNVWMVINNAADTYEIFIQGGELENVTQVDAAGQTVLGLRNGPAANDLINVYFRSDHGHWADFLIDDVYLDVTGRNLSDPTALAAGSR